MLILICGHSRAGKTTYSQNFNCRVIHLDDCGCHKNVISKIKNITDDIIVEGIYYSPKERKKLVETYQGEGKKCIYINTSKEVRQKRLGHKIKHDYPFLVPTYDEGWDEIIEIKGDS